MPMLREERRIWSVSREEELLNNVANQMNLMIPNHARLQAIVASYEVSVLLTFRGRICLKHV